jgi:hypothetical protein
MLTLAELNHTTEKLFLFTLRQSASWQRLVAIDAIRAHDQQ